MDRNCDKCIHHTSGTCSSWDCKMQTVEGLVKETREKAIEEFAERLCTVCCGESVGVILGNKVKADMLTVDGVCELAYEIAEAMKGE